MAARTLVFAPHPDDEVLGCGGTIARKALAGTDVRVVIMTDGRTSHAHLIDPEQLVLIRRAEAGAAARELGLDPTTCTFLDFPDGELHRHRTPAIAAVSDLLGSFQPDEVYVPHRDDRQPDHVATYHIVQSALRRHAPAVRMFEYPVWLWHAWPWTRGAGPAGGMARSSHLLGTISAMWELAFRCRERSDVSDVLDRKLRALGAYHSQMERRGGDPRWPVLADVADGEFLRHFTGPEEYFRSSRGGLGRSATEGTGADR